MSQPEKVWVIASDYGCEGLGEPTMAFFDEATAHRFAETMAKHAGYAKVLEVPVWRSFITSAPAPDERRDFDPGHDGPHRGVA